ncbi:hypothetical protein B566_EDAN004867 [Ephemera danica]|nr:hypothetical protein B566_EDAN004867 [Ephemera danica]
MLIMDFEEEIVFKTASDKCLPYNKHNNSRIFTSTYEGIPENLLINFVGWLLLVILFAILRKNAWNYGRIALVQKAEGNNRWTQIFYGNVDEPENVSTDEGSLSSIDSSLFIEKGVYSWLTSVFKIKDRHILRKCGSDAVQYLAFQRHVIFYMTVIMVVSLGIVLPINFQGDLQGNEKTFGHTTLSNLKPDSQLLWAHVVLALLYVPLGIIVMRRFSLSVPLQKEDAHVSRTLLITNIPRVMCDKNDLERHFREAYPELGEDGVEDIQLAYDIAAISKLDHQREKAAQAVGYCESFCRTSGGQTLDMRPYVCGNSCCCCDIFGFAKIDAKEYYKEEEQRLSTQLEREKERVLQHPLGIVFVTLVSLEAAQRIYEDHTRSCKCSSNPSSSSLSRQLEPHNWMGEFIGIIQLLVLQGVRHQLYPVCYSVFPDHSHLRGQHARHSQV